VRVALKNVPGTDTVDVSLNQGSATVNMKANNTTALKDVLEAITKNGFVTKQTVVTARGVLVKSDGKWRLKITGSNEELAVETAPNVALSEGAATIEGVVPEVSKGKAPSVVQLRSVKMEGGK
jgi:copper chaperone CopZ